VIHLGSALNLRGIVVCSLRPLPLWRQGVLHLFGCCGTFSARPSHPNQEGPRADSWTREAERCTGVTNAVFGEADGAAVLAERAPPLTGRGREGEVVRIR
jgi:hypothetical protein